MTTLSKRRFLAGALAFTLSSPIAMSEDSNPPKESLEKISLGAGCFWCIEAIYNRLEGVQSSVSGYQNGFLKNPTYKDICTGATGHAEVVLVTFDSNKISLKEILAWFWKAHDPTTLNRQGNDVGTQYRSGIFYYTDEQKKVAEASLKEAQSEFSKKIVTEITKAQTFYPAEAYHQNYYRDNKNKNGYCQYVITPKMNKLGLEDKPKLAE